ncbi:hypothetical protein SBOR_7374 [Sclerotinia borealis F-4128]|uniref:Uncharacterized protein n=1 Tax=Sclerotinia borealis (strain F-4128) TaxID=1432307 RepID=W9C8W7_SCLBF|nr:hypothetical protein SBOR_7374 [Sclerotinia borealis F-4128]
MERLTWPNIDDFCRECMMLDDPRDALIINRQTPGRRRIANLVEQYLDSDPRLQSSEIQTLAKGMPMLTEGQESEVLNLRLFNAGAFEILSEQSITRLNHFVNEHLMPYFWFAVTRRHPPLFIERLVYVRLRHILLLNIGMRLTKHSLTMTEMHIAMDFERPVQTLSPNEIPLRDSDECGICRTPLHETDE